jgi:hypothetical protein
LQVGSGIIPLVLSIPPSGISKGRTPIKISG